MTCCPSCGYNLTKDEVIERDGWVLDPRGLVLFGGKPVKMRPSAKVLLHTLAQAGERPVTNDVLVQRCTHDEGEWGYSTIKAQISFLRRLLREQRIPDPIETVWSVGYRWRIAA